jgi:pilus assembly protein CpaE
LADLLLMTPSLAFVEQCRLALSGTGGTLENAWEQGSGDVDHLLHVARSAEPLIVAIGPGLGAGVAVELAEVIGRELPEVVLVLFAEASDELWRDAARAGVRDIIDPNLEVAELRRTLLRDLSAARDRWEKLNAAGLTHHGQLITVISPKGGSGKTMVSSSLAVALARLDAGSVVLVDLDLQFGDVPTALSILPDYSMYDLAHAADELDTTTVKVFLTPHPSGIFVLAAPVTPAEAERISLETVDRVLALLRRAFDIVVVDTGAGVDEFALKAIEVADDVIALSSMDVASATSLKKELRILDQVGLTGARRHLVVNRVDTGIGLTVLDIERLMGMTAVARIPRKRTVLAAMNQGRALTELNARSEEAKAILDLGRQLIAIGQDAEASAPTVVPRWNARREA